MKSKVYFVAAEDADDIVSVNEKLKNLLTASKVLGGVAKKDTVAVKMHFGEEGNTGFVRPEHARVIGDAIKARGAKPILSDTNTLYRGRRTNSKDHVQLAHDHGFTKQVTGCDVVVPDDRKKKNVITATTGGKNIKSAKVARFYIDADAIVAVNHFKGHMMSSFGGALKNVGMGCASREGKLAQHCDVSPVLFAERCIGCGACAKICPAGAIHMDDGKAVLDGTKCIGCANCVGVCQTFAMFVDLESGTPMQKKMIEYAAAVLKGKKNKKAFINFAVRINKECDCWGLENPRIAPDVGILASTDPVAADAASYDLVKKACGKDIFKEMHPGQDGAVQLKHAETLKLGSRRYELIRV